MRPIEEILERLLNEGFLQLPKRSAEEDPGYAFIEPSEAAIAAGKRVRDRVLSRLGLADVGAYVARERRALDLKPKEISRRVKISSEVLADVENNRLPFFRVPFRKAADLVEALKLDPAVVISLLSALDVSDIAEDQPAPMLRTNIRLTESKRKELETNSLAANQERSDKQAQLKDFIEMFVEELLRRGIIK